MGVLDKLFDKHKIDNTLARDLTKPVVKLGGTITTFSRAFYRMVHQLDLLYLPEDSNKKKYLLVVVDIGTGITDARPLASRDARTVLNAIQDIYQKKKYLKEPLRMQVDAGTEFSETIKYFRDRNVGVRIAATGRHSQQAIVERLNKTIGSAILKLQLNNELATGNHDTNWVTYLPDILSLINEHAKKTKKQPPLENDEADAKCEGTECDLLEEGSLVRVKLDYPRDIHGTRLHGNFRSGDFRWSLKPAKIEKVLMFPNQPIRYVVAGYKNNTFAKWELMPYQKPALMKLTNDMFVIEALLDKKKVKNKIFYLVKWKDYDASQNTWESKEEMVRAAPNLVAAFEMSKK